MNANKADGDGKGVCGDSGGAGRHGCRPCRGRVPYAGIAGQERLRLIRRPVVRSVAVLTLVEPGLVEPGAAPKCFFAQPESPRS